MTTIEFIYYPLASIFYFLFISVFIWFVVNLLHARNYEQKINKLYSELETKIKEEKAKPIVMSAIEGSIKRLEAEYKPKIKELERKRQFILDKLPFIK